MTKSKIHIAIRWISCALFLVGLLAPAHTNYTNLEQSNFMFISIKVIFLLSPCVLLIYRGNLGVFCDLRLIKQFGFYFCFLFYCGLSVLFSADPTFSLLKFAALLIGSLSSMCLVIDISNRPPTQASLRLFMVMLIVSPNLNNLIGVFLPGGRSATIISHLSCVSVSSTIRANTGKRDISWRRCQF